MARTSARTTSSVNSAADVVSKAATSSGCSHACTTERVTDVCSRTRASSISHPVTKVTTTMAVYAAAQARGPEAAPLPTTPKIAMDRPSSRHQSETLNVVL